MLKFWLSSVYGFIEYETHTRGSIFDYTNGELFIVLDWRKVEIYKRGENTYEIISRDGYQVKKDGFTVEKIESKF